MSCSESFLVGHAQVTWKRRGSLVGLDQQIVELHLATVFGGSGADDFATRL